MVCLLIVSQIPGMPQEEGNQSREKATRIENIASGRLPFRSQCDHEETSSCAEKVFIASGVSSEKEERCPRNTIFGAKGVLLMSCELKLEWMEDHTSQHGAFQGEKARFERLHAFLVHTPPLPAQCMAAPYN